MYELTAEWKFLQEIDEQFQDENEGLCSAEIEDRILEIEGQREVCFEQCVKAIKNLEADAEKVGAEIARLRGKKDALAKRVERIENYLLNNMELGEKVQAHLWTLEKKLNPFSVVVEATELAEVFKKWSWQPDKTAIKKALKEGVVIEGCSLQRKEALRIS